MLDGACRIPQLVQRAADLGMSAVGLTDHGSMAGAVELYKAASKIGIKPLLGCEVYVVARPAPAQARRGRARLEPSHAARRDDRRLPQPRQALHARLPRGLLLQASRRLRAARALRRRPDLPLGLHGRRHLPGAAAGRRAGRARRARPARLDLRRGGRLRRAAGRRHARARRDQPGPPAHRRRRRPARRRHRRRALPARRGRRPARRAALHPDERAARRPEPLPLRDQGVLSQDPGRDARADGALGRQPAGPTLEIAERCNVELELGTLRLPRFDEANGDSFGMLAPALRGGARAALRAHRRRDPRAARVRAADDRRDGLRRLLPDRLGLRALRQEERRHRRPRPRLGGRLARRLLPADHRPRPDRERPALRALPEPGPQVHARHRHRLLGAGPRARVRVRHREVRPRPRGADHHVLEAAGEGVRARRRPRDGHALRRRRPHREADPRGPGRQPGRLHEAEPGAREGVRGGRVRAPDRRDGAAARGPDARRLDPRRGRRDRRPPAHGVPAAAAEGQRRGRRHAVHDERRRGARPAQDGLPRPAQPRRHRRRRAHRARVRGHRPRRSLRPADGRPADLRHAGARRHARRLPVRVVGHARRAAPGQADLLRRPRRARRAVPAGPDAEHPAVRAAQERPGADDLPAPEARGGARRDHGHHGVPGAVDADRQGHRRLHARRGRRSAQGDRQEGQGADGLARAEVPRGLHQERHHGRGREEPLGRQRALRRLLVQQGARRLLRADRLPDRLPQGELPGALHGGADLVRHVDEGQGAVLRRREHEHGHRRAAARRQHAPARTSWSSTARSASA